MVKRPLILSITGIKALHIRRVPRPHLGADGIAVLIEHDTDDHLVQIGTMILAVAKLADRSSLSLKIEGGRVEEDDVEGAEEILAQRNSSSSMVSLVHRGEKVRPFWSAISSPRKAMAR